MSGILRLHRKRDVVNYNRITDLLTDREKFHISPLGIVRKFLTEGSYRKFAIFSQPNPTYECDF